MHIYDDTFYKYINIGSTRSASIVLPHLIKELKIDSVIDFGCGQGAWLAIWEKLGVKKVAGVDGDYIDQDQLLIKRDDFYKFDLSQRITLNNKYTLVQSLEVAEHIPQASSDIFIENLIKHGDMVLFSAAVPGQGGEDHQNEQSYEFWRKIFEKYEYYPFDYIRPKVLENAEVEPWYRYNMMLYVKKDQLNNLPESIIQLRIPANKNIKDVSPLLYQLRKLFIRMLPVFIQTQLAVLKKHWFARKVKQ